MTTAKSAARLRVAVLVSGSGTNLQSILDAIEADALRVDLVAVLCNRPGAGAIARAERFGVETLVVDHKSFPKREDFDARVVELLEARSVELVCLAGFDRLITPVFVRPFAGRILNIHPALLPAFPGLHAQRQAFEYGVRLAGCTVHFVDEEMDSGPIVLQAAVPVFDDDDAETLRLRILAEEHRIFPEAIRLYAEKRLHVEGRRVRILPAR